MFSGTTIVSALKLLPRLARPRGHQCAEEDLESNQGLLGSFAIRHCPRHRCAARNRFGTWVPEIQSLRKCLSLIRKNTGKPDFRISPGGTFTGTSRLCLHSFLGVHFRRPSNHIDQERGHYIDKEQEHLHHILVHLYLGSSSRLHIGPQRTEDRWSVLGDHLELLCLPVRPLHICPIPRWPVIPRTKCKCMRRGHE